MATRSSLTQVMELDHKLSRAVMVLRLSTRKELAERLGGIHAANFNRWMESDGFVPNHHVQRLADLMRMSAARFAETSCDEFDHLTEYFRPDATPWQMLLERARMALIALRPVSGRSTPMLAMRGVVQESQWDPAATGQDIFHVGDRICVDLSVPWDYFGKVTRVQALLLETDALGSALVTPGRRPLAIGRRQSVVTVPPTGPDDPFVITQPTGPQSFTALFMMEPLDAALVADLQGAATGAQPMASYLDPDLLNALAMHVLHLGATDWAVAHKRFLVEAG